MYIDIVCVHDAAIHRLTNDRTHRKWACFIRDQTVAVATQNNTHKNSQYDMDGWIDWRWLARRRALHFNCTRAHRIDRRVHKPRFTAIPRMRAVYVSVFMFVFMCVSLLCVFNYTVGTHWKWKKVHTLRSSVQHWARLFWGLFLCIIFVSLDCPTNVRHTAIAAFVQKSCARMHAVNIISGQYSFK